MQSLIKMSRLETGTFVLHMKEAPLSETIARAMSGVWAAAERKHISLEVQCHEELTAFMIQSGLQRQWVIFWTMR